ncbi:MAG: twin-arginine translocase subunit TatC, partial [Chloroflexi bacterium]|nr:twin-arginine translocase subunit TatC [Chloroflexota bacterium]
MANDRELTILEHLAELRSALVKAAIAVLVTSTLS